MGITLSALRLRKDRARLARIWLAIRVWDAILFVDLIIQAILEFTNGFHDRGGPWLVTGLVAIFFAVASTSRVRASVSRFVATVGVKKDDFLEAEKAAKLVWLDIDVADRDRLLEAAEARGRRTGEAEVTICGTRFHLA